MQERAIVALFSFVAMMLHRGMEEIHENVLRYLPIGGGLISFLEIFLIPSSVKKSPSDPLPLNSEVL